MISEAFGVEPGPVNGNTSHPCVDCGQYAIVTHPVVVPIGKRRVIDTVCGRCYLQRTIDR